MEYMSYFQYNSKVILTFFFLSLFVMIIHTLTKAESTKYIFSTYSNSSLLNPLTYVKFFTYVLGHGDWDHFIHNFLYILLIGPMVEEKYGSYELLVMFLITAAVGGIGNRILKENTVAYGASGIVFMLIVLSSFVNLEAGKIPITLVLIIMFYIIQEIFAGITKKDNVSHSGHLLGGACGLLFGFYFR